MPDPTSDEKWRRILTGDLPDLDLFRRSFRRIPTAPRCKLCQAPFGGIGGTLLRLTPWRRWQANSTLCSICVGNLDKSVRGAEVEATFLFADIRGSTGVAEHMRPAAYRELLQRFYRVCAMAVPRRRRRPRRQLPRRRGRGLLRPGLHRRRSPAASAIRTGLRILDGVAAGDEPSWLPVGVGVHSSLAYVGVFGTENGQLDFTGVGDAVNTAARLGSVAAAGELLVSIATAERANLATDRLERRTLELKGREEPVEVVVLMRPAVAT